MRTLLFAVMALAACSPTLNWREVRPEHSGAFLLLPCKAEVEQRGSMGLAQCKAGDAQFALSWALLDAPEQVTPALQQMREGLQQRLQAQARAPHAVQISGMTPNAAALSQSLDAPGLHAELAVFARGLRVYQLLMTGKKADPAAWDTLLSSLRLE
ncbi:MAG TPA: hypothetical protein VGE47_00390 [Burkholderiaceae bacterium]